MATIRIHQEDQENRITADLRGRGKENHIIVSTQTQTLQQQNKRAVLGVLHNNCARNVIKSVRIYLFLFFLSFSFFSYIFPCPLKYWQMS